MIRHRDPRRQEGQAIVLVVLAMAVFFAVALFVVDGARLFVERRAAQNAADAAALAAAQDLPSGATVGATTNAYASNNGFPGVDHPCPSQTTGTNCYWRDLPDVPGKIEVRVSKHVTTFFGGVVEFLSGGSYSGFDVHAHAVASETPITQQHCVFTPPVVNPDQYLPNCVIPAQPGQTGTVQAASADHCQFNPPVTNPDQYLPNCIGPITGGLNGSVALIMSRDCSAISYTGAGGGAIGALATNGGLNFQGNAPKKVASLGSPRGTTSDNHPGCPNAPPSPPSGDSTQCTSTSNNLCAKTLVDLSSKVPLKWSVTPPSLPTPLAAGTAWTASSSTYPTRCVNLGTSNVTFSPAATYTPPGNGGNTTASGPPGIYCATGAGKTISLSGNFNTQTDSSGNADGYTFFALNGSQIAVASNGTKIKFYWPHACGSRPASRDTDGDGVNDATFTCFGQTVATGYNSATCSGLCYDPQILFYATNSTAATSCASSAICVNGQNGSLDGDLFAPNGPALPSPYPAQASGGTVWVAGGAASTGSGFIQSWWLDFQGNTGSYTGTGMNVGGSPQIGTFVAGNAAHCVFNPPVVNPDQYLPNCVIPGTAEVDGALVTTTVGKNISMDE